MRSRSAALLPPHDAGACRVLFVAVTVVALLLSACDGESTTAAVDGGVNAAPLPLESLAVALAAVECELRPMCTAIPLRNPGGDCVAQLAARREQTLIAQIRDGIARGTVVYDAAAAAACPARLRALQCGALQAPIERLCDDAFPGLLAAEAPCAFDVECAGEQFCAGDEAMCPGRCQARGVLEAACEDDGECLLGLRCPEIGGKCSAPIAENGACEFAGKPCDFGLFCFVPDILGEGRCLPSLQAFAPIGSPCNVLAGYRCAAGGFCPIFPDRPGEQPACVGPSPRGGPCRVSLPDPCPLEQFCEGSLNQPGTCVARKPRGQPCELSRQCALGDVCDGGLCVAQAALGGACQTDDGCLGGACLGGACVVPSSCEAH